MYECVQLLAKFISECANKCSYPDYSHRDRNCAVLFHFVHNSATNLRGQGHYVSDPNVVAERDGMST
jgi:hypothetical protein